MAQLHHRAELASAKSADNTRHKCFISYHVDDMDEVGAFLDNFGSEFIPRSVGITDEADFIDSDDPDYIKRRIREDFLTDSTVTIVLLGKCTWARKFVDWEISSSLRNDVINKRSGLLAIPLPSTNNPAVLPARVRVNWSESDPEGSYALYKPYPKAKATLRANIDAAFNKRDMTPDNSAALRQRNGTC